MKQTIDADWVELKMELDETDKSQLQTELDTFIPMQEKELVVLDDGTEEFHYWT